MTRAVTFTSHAHLCLRQLPGQHVALIVGEVPSFYSDHEVLTIARAVQAAGALPLELRVPWNELLGVGLAAGVLDFGTVACVES